MISTKEFAQKIFTMKLFFAKCQQFFESYALIFLKKIQVIIVKLFEQDKNSTIFIFVLLASVEVYQFIVEKVFRHFIDSNSQKSTIYKRAMIFSHFDN